MIFKLISILLSILLFACRPSGQDKKPSENPENNTNGDGNVTESYRQVSADEAAEIMKNEVGYIIVDVRRADEFAEGHIKDAVNIPNESIEDNEIELLPDKDQLILVYCRSGNRSKQASEKLAELGYTNIVEFGGILDWKGEIVTPESGDSTAPEKEVDLTADFTVYTADLSAVNLSDFFGKPIVINFFATWCPPCKAELPAFNLLYEKYKDEVIFIMINVDGTGKAGIDNVESFISANNYNFPVYYDLTYSASDAYEVTAIPETFFINADGSLSGSYLGAMSEKLLESYITKITAN